MSSTIGAGLQAGHAEPSRMHADRLLHVTAETAMSGFNWSDKSAIAIERVDAVAVYQNEYGDIVIRQQGYADDEDSVVVVPRSRLDDLILALRNEASA